MSLWAKLALVPPFLVGLLLCFQALVQPEALSTTLGGITGTAPHGEASIFADFAALFLTYTIGVGTALFAGKRSWLWAPISLFGLTAIMRLFHGFSNGFPPEAAQTIAIELIMCALMIFAMRSKPI